MTPAAAVSRAFDAHPDCQYAEVALGYGLEATAWIVCLWPTREQREAGVAPTTCEAYPAPGSPPDGRSFRDAYFEAKADAARRRRPRKGDT